MCSGDGSPISQTRDDVVPGIGEPEFPDGDPPADVRVVHMSLWLDRRRSGFECLRPSFEGRIMLFTTLITC